MSISITMPDGHAVDLEFADNSNVLGVNTSTHFADSRGMRGYMTGPIGYHEAACELAVKSELKSRSVFRDFEMRIAIGNDGLVTTAALRGPYHDLLTVFGGPPIEEQQVRAAYDGFDYLDTADGFVMTATQGLSAVRGAQDASVVVADRGVLHVMIGDDALQSVPNWAGTPTEHGEVWRLEDDEGYVSYVLAFETAAAEFVTGSFGDDSDPAWAAWLYGLSIASASR